MKKIKDLIQRLIIFAHVGKFIVITPHRLEMLQKAIQYVKNEKVPGSYFEFGVARGLTFAGAYLLVKKYNAPISKFYAFDSFEGFPELGEIDKKFERFKTGDEKWPTEDFDKTLHKASVDRNHIEVVRGWFKDSLNPELSNRLLNNKIKASVIWIDCDLYESTKDVLNFITPLLQNGTIIIFDDWYCYHSDPNKGEQRALAEYLKKEKEVIFFQYHKFGIVGNSFIANIKVK